MKSKWIFLIIAAESLVLLCVLYLLDLLDLKMGITLVLVEMMAAIFIDFLNKRNEAMRIKREEESKQKEKLEQEKNKKREVLKSYIHEHNQKLIDTVIKYWYTISPQDITCRMMSIDTIINPWYEDKFVSKNESFTTEHLQTGYGDIWKLRQECKTLKDDLSSEENILKDYIKNKLQPDIPQFGWSRNGVTIDDIELLIYKTVENFSKKGLFPDNYIANLSLFGYRVEDQNEKYLVDKKEIFRKRIETIIKDKTLYEMFQTANKTRKLSYKKIDEFYQGLKQIEHDSKRHIELKGTCKDCKDWLDELKSLK